MDGEVMLQPVDAGELADVGGGMACPFRPGPFESFGALLDSLFG
jgi:hypothetical protein